MLNRDHIEDASNLLSDRSSCTNLSHRTHVSVMLMNPQQIKKSIADRKLYSKRPKASVFAANKDSATRLSVVSDAK